MPQRYHPYDPSDPKPATMYPADEGAYVKWEDYVVLLRRSHDLNMEVWKAVVDTDVFQDLKHGKYKDILTLLSDGEISVGKAAEAITERAGGLSPLLPDWNPPEQDYDLSWRERYDKLKSEFDENLKITG